MWTEYNNVYVVGAFFFLTLILGVRDHVVNVTFSFPKYQLTPLFHCLWSVEDKRSIVSYVRIVLREYRVEATHILEQIPKKDSLVYVTYKLWQLLL